MIKSITKSTFVSVFLLFLSSSCFAASCNDDADFLFGGAIGKDCNWVKKKPNRRCKKVDSITKTEIHASCLETCGKCLPVTDNDDCADKKSFRFKNRSKKSCDWVGTQRKKKRTKLCKKKAIRKNCPSTCVATVNGVKCNGDVPSDVPSMVPSNVASLVPSNVPSDVPSMVPSNVPSLVPSDVPSNVPSNVPSDVTSMIPSNVPKPNITNAPTSAPTTQSPTASPTTKVPTDSPTFSPTFTTTTETPTESLTESPTKALFRDRPW